MHITLAIIRTLLALACAIPPQARSIDENEHFDAGSLVKNCWSRSLEAVRAGREDMLAMQRCLDGEAVRLACKKHEAVDQLYSLEKEFRDACGTRAPFHEPTASEWQPTTIFRICAERHNGFADGNVPDGKVEEYALACWTLELNEHVRDLERIQNATAVGQAELQSCKDRKTQAGGSHV